jgi:DNA-binding LacI/PurR family transcriptional regulator
MSDNKLRYIKVKEDILKGIASKKPHERLPSRTKLVEKYNVTRTTIERAISELIGEGYLYSMDGSGTYVSEDIQRNASSANNGPASWGVILPNVMHDTYPGILRGIEDIAQENDINVIVCNSDNIIEKQSNYIYKLIESGVQGIITVPTYSGEGDIKPFEQLQKEKIPFIFCNRSVNGVVAPRVASNSFYGGYIATKHLIQTGSRRIGFISRPLYCTSEERYQGYLSALFEAGIKLDESYVIFEDSFDIEIPGYESTRTLLKNEPIPDAIFCFNDALAEGAYKAISENNLSVGKDIKIIGYDNTRICERLPVKLTSVKFKTYEIGKSAAELLINITKDKDLIDSFSKKIIILQPELVIRESCGCGS